MARRIHAPSAHVCTQFSEHFCLILQTMAVFTLEAGIIRLNELGEKFVTRLVIRIYYKGGHKTHYPFRRTIFCRAT